MDHKYWTVEYFGIDDEFKNLSPLLPPKIGNELYNVLKFKESKRIDTLINNVCEAEINNVIITKHNDIDITSVTETSFSLRINSLITLLKRIQGNIINDIVEIMKTLISSGNNKCSFEFILRHDNEYVLVVFQCDLSQNPCASAREPCASAREPLQGSWDLNIPVLNLSGLQANYVYVYTRFSLAEADYDQE